VTHALPSTGARSATTTERTARPVFMALGAANTPPNLSLSFSADCTNGRMVDSYYGAAKAVALWLVAQQPALAQAQAESCLRVLSMSSHLWVSCRQVQIFRPTALWWSCRASASVFGCVAVE